MSVESSNIKGGAGSGNFGHAGRPGEVGGSSDSSQKDPQIGSKDYIESTKWHHYGRPDLLDKSLTLTPRGRYGAYLYVSAVPMDSYQKLNRQLYEVSVRVKDESRVLVLPKSREARDKLLDEVFAATDGDIESRFDIFVLPHSDSDNVELAIFNTDLIELKKSPDMEKSFKGGVGSGNFGHAGRPGEVGGSGAGGVDINSEAFKKWFGDSKVVDSDGKPLVVYKGMSAYDYRTSTVDYPGDPITTIHRIGSFPAFNNGEGGTKIEGGFFTDDPEVASHFASVITKNGMGNAVYPVYLSFQNPYIIDAKGEFAGVVQFEETGLPFRQAIRSGKYDSVIIKNTKDEGTVYVALSSNQIKSAIGNRGTFATDDDDINKSLKATPEFSGFLWNPYMRSFVPLIGKPVDTSALRKTVSEIRRASANRMASLAQGVLDGEITNLAQFAVEFKESLKNLYLSTHVLARGGVAQMTQSDWGKLGVSLREQYSFADNFVRDIENERTSMPIVPRIEMYTDSAWGAAGEFENVVRDRELKLGSLERRVLGDADHCDDCIELAERDWQPPSLLPDIGDTECGPGCACTFEFENTQLDELAQAFGGKIRPKNPASGHTEIGVEGEPETFHQFTLYPDMEKAFKGGAGSGNFGHSGRPGLIGGSGDAGYSTSLRQFANDEEAYGWHEQGVVREWAYGLAKEDAAVLNEYAGFGYSDINRNLRGQPPMKTFERDATEEEIAQVVANKYKPIDLGDGKTLRMGAAFNGVVSWRDIDTDRLDSINETTERINDVIANRGITLTESFEVTRAAYLPGVTVEDLRNNIGSTREERGFTSTFLGPAGGRADGDGYVSYGVSESKYKRFDGDVDHQEIGTAVKFQIELPQGTRVASVEAARRTFRYSSGRNDLDDPAQRVESEVLLGSGARFRVLSVSNQTTILASHTHVPYVSVRMRYIGGGSSGDRP